MTKYRLKSRGIITWKSDGMTTQLSQSCWIAKLCTALNFARAVRPCYS